MTMDGYGGGGVYGGGGGGGRGYTVNTSSGKCGRPGCPRYTPPLPNQPPLQVMIIISNYVDNDNDKENS